MHSNKYEPAYGNIKSPKLFDDTNKTVEGTNHNHYVLNNHGDQNLTLQDITNNLFKI